MSHQLGRYEDLLRALLPVGVQLRYVDDDCWIAADRYLLLPQLSMSSCGALPVGYTAQLQAFGARFAGMTGQPARRRLFISRQQASMRRISNFDQLAPLLQAHGVEVVALETLSVAAQAALFHLHNLALAEGHALLLTGRRAPHLWALGLADLQSRIEGAPHVKLGPPDDALLAAVLAKLFADRQIAPRPDAIPFLVARMDRSFEAAAAVVERLDRAALSEGRNITARLAAQLLGQGGGDG